MSLANFEPIKQQILDAIQHDPDIKYLFLGWMTDQFVPKTDYSQLLADIKHLREDMQKLREDMQRGFAKHDHEIKELREDMLRGFDEQRAESEKRWAENEKRWAENEKRWEANEKRWEANEKRWEESDRKFEAVHQDISELKQDMAEVKQDVSELKQDVGKLQVSLDSLRDFLNVTVGGFQNRAGENLENMVASVMRFALKNPDIQSDSLKLRQKIVDVDGLIGRPARQYEYDLLAHNGVYYVIEIRAGGGAKYQDIAFLVDKAHLVKQHFALPTLPQAVFITLGKTKAVQEACDELDVLLVG